VHSFWRENHGRDIYIIRTVDGIYLTNYNLYKNAGYWLINSRDIFFLQIQALHCEFVEFLLHVGVFA
jgi:hypothetical protein